MAVAECVRHGAECPHNHMNLESGALVIAGFNLNLKAHAAAIMNKLLQVDGVVKHAELVEACFANGAYIGKQRAGVAREISGLNNLIRRHGWEIKTKRNGAYILKIAGDVVDCEAFG